VIDAGICHGGRALAHLFNRLHQADRRSGSPLMRPGAGRRGPGITRGEGIGGFLAWAPNARGSSTGEDAGFPHRLGRHRAVPAGGGDGAVEARVDRSASGFTGLTRERLGEEGVLAFSHHLDSPKPPSQTYSRRGVADETSFFRLYRWRESAV